MQMTSDALRVGEEDEVRGTIIFRLTFWAEKQIFTERAPNQSNQEIPTDQICPKWSGSGLPQVL